MASISYKEIRIGLEEIAHNTTAQEFVYDLLRIFGKVTATTINRIKEGRDNLSKDKTTIIAKFGKPKIALAYRPATADVMQSELEFLKADVQVEKHKARLLIVSNGETVLAYDPIEEEEYENKIALLWKDYNFFMPLAGVERFRNIEENEADVKASYIMAKIYDDIRRYNDITDDEQIRPWRIYRGCIRYNEH